MTNDIIKIENLRRDFKVGSETVHALRGISFSIRAGEFVTIMGTSGSGKSTLLNILGCLDTPTSGDYYLDGIAVKDMGKNDRATLRNRKIGFVFQSYNLLPKTTALENVELPLLYNPAFSSRKRREKAMEALKAVSLSDQPSFQPNVRRTATTCSYRTSNRERPGDPTGRRGNGKLGYPNLIRDPHAFSTPSRRRKNHYIRDS